MTDSPGEDKGRSEDPEVVKGRLHQPKETPESTSLMLQELPEPSSQGPSDTCSLESAIVMAKAETPPYVASATYQQDEDGRQTETPPADVNVKQRKDEEGRRTTTMSKNPGYYYPSAVKENNTTRTINILLKF